MLSCFTGLYETYPTNAEPECCDVRWELSTDNQSKGTKKSHDSTLCHRTSLTASSASRLCNSRLKLCVLVLILLHTVLAVSAAQNSTGLGFENLRILEDRSTHEEQNNGSLQLDRHATGPLQQNATVTCNRNEVLVPYNQFLQVSPNKNVKMGQTPNFKDNMGQLFID